MRDIFDHKLPMTKLEASISEWIHRRDYGTYNILCFSYGIILATCQSC